MALEDEGAPRAAAREARIGGSIAVELEWVMSSSRPRSPSSDAAQRGQPQHPSLARLYDAAPQLAARVHNLWGDDQEASWGAMGLAILAQRGGLLFLQDPDALLDRLDSLCTAAPEPAELRLASETDGDAAAIRRRLARLRSSPDLRRRYVDLVRDLWSAVAEEWRRSGQPAVDAMVRARRELALRGAPWQEVAATPRKHLKEACVECVASLPAGGVVAVVPAYFAVPTGYLDLPGAVLISIPAESGAAEARARAEVLARRLKAMSDPTRLAILQALHRDPATVTELAETFSLAQPTVSNHVKLLRDAGLVQAAPRGGRRALAVSREVLREVAAHLESMLGEGGDAAGGAGLPGD